MKSSSRRSLRRSSRTPREQFIVPAGVAAGGPFLPSGFLLPVFPSARFPFRWVSFRGASFRCASLNGRDLPRCWDVAFSDRFSAECRLKVVGICRAATAWHFATKTIGMDFPGWSGFATLLQPGVSRPFFSRRPSENGRDLPRCDSQANPDHSFRRAPAARLPPPASPRPRGTVSSRRGTHAGPAPSASRRTSGSHLPPDPSDRRVGAN